MNESFSSDRAARLESVVGEAIEVDPAQRPAFLDRACADDAALRLEAESLILAFETGAVGIRGVLERLPFAAPGGASDAAAHLVAADRLAGQRIGHYEVLDRLGGGGMGVVYKALDTRLDRHVALKFLPPYLSADEEAKVRFMHEARAASALDHPRICPVYDVGEWGDGLLYIAMPFYDGETMRRRLARGPMDPGVAARCVAQVAEGLDKAHAAGIVHRDVKPANLLILTEGDLKILDFGIAKVAGVDLTRPGTRWGTVSYMSPEQIRGEAVDARTDLWSLGVVLYEALTGRHPFKADHDQARIYAILNTEPDPVSRLRPGIPQELEDVTRRLLAKSADCRYQSARALLEDLAPFRSDSGVRSTGSALPRLRLARGRSGRFIAAALLLLAVVTGAYWFAARQPAPAIRSIAVLPVEDLSLDQAQQYFVDGMHGALIDALSHIGSLRVISRTSSAQFRESERSLPDIARALNVEGVVEASIYRDTSTVNIQVRLIQAFPEERQLWTQSFRRTMEHVPAMHFDVARAIAEQIRLELSPHETRRLAEARPVDVRTYEAYLRGMFLLNQSTEEEFRRGLEYLHEAVALDPADARAYTGLAFGYITLGHGSGAVENVWSVAREATERALRLDSTLAEAWAALADIKTYHERDWVGAEEAFRRANALNPNLAMNRYHHAWYLTAVGRTEEALAEHRRAQELDPLTPLHTVWIPGVYLWSGRYEEALESARRTAESYPDNATALFLLGASAAQLGRFDEAIEAHEKMASISEAWQFALGRTYAMAGRTNEARLILAQLAALPSNPWRAYWRSIIHAALGEIDQAYHWLSQDPPHAWIGWGRGDPALEPLRDDPRFEAFARRFNLPA